MHKTHAHNTIKTILMIALLIVSLQINGFSQQSKTDQTPTPNGARQPQPAAPATVAAPEYKETNLPFNAVNLKFQGGGGYSETVGEDGKIKPDCAGLSLDSLSLGGHEIALQSTDVTSNAMIVTKDCGNLRIRINMGNASYSILVTSKQEELFQKLLNGQQ